MAHRRDQWAGVMSSDPGRTTWAAKDDKVDPPRPIAPHDGLHLSTKLGTADFFRVHRRRVLLTNLGLAFIDHEKCRAGDDPGACGSRRTRTVRRPRSARANTGTFGRSSNYTAVT